MSLHRRRVNESESRKQVTVCYTLPDGKGNYKQICRKTFEDTFSLSHKKVLHLTEMKKEGKNTYTDNRGKNKSARKYSDVDVTFVVNHINSFPKIESHYSRKKTSKQYPSPDLNINRIYQIFKAKFPNTKITYKFYSKIFHKHFSHLKFGLPRSDTCSTCDLYNVKIKGASNASETGSLKNNLDLHHRKAEKATNTMKDNIKNSQEPTSQHCTIAVDLQQVIFIPSLTHGDMFYLRQLSVFNLGNHIGETNQAFMCLWHEGTTGRGGNEIASCVLKVLRANATNKKILNLWTDNSICQNKNMMMLLALILLVKEGTLDEIHHKYLVKGHSYLPCDRDFALIEKRKKVTKTIVLDDVDKMITSTRHNNPFKVVRMNNEDFF
ncbi:hypothetical protein NQ314_000506 [Rhamnusium bicolor]|uniref:DUF7869 domain-containing protein n=1 Tax=Rhamnusium bicolor TaxID=1586634 RepID=A0AAV8ZY54_9CUCU|nr:hypothetical protein NQ314_000506 [Rhamnusium bicolor]